MGYIKEKTRTIIAKCKGSSWATNIIEKAQSSFLTQESGEYYVSENDRTKVECIDCSEVNYFVLLQYDASSKEVKYNEVYIGIIDKIDTEKWIIVYHMMIHLEGTDSERVIHSIMDKIDFDPHKDYEKKEYLLINDMRRLYNELDDRVNSVKQIEESVFEKSDYSSDYSTTFDSMAQKSEYAVHPYSRIHLYDDSNPYRYDREIIERSRAFRRMVDKAQIFGSERGDYFRTRMTHTLEVTQIAKAIGEKLRLNLDLIEAIALGHDIGHTPFGHQGERTLHDILTGNNDVGIRVKSKEYDREDIKNRFGGFKHNYQSVRILTILEDIDEKYPGLNIDLQVIEGILKHTKLKGEDIDVLDYIPREYKDKIEGLDKDGKVICSTLEGQVVAIADEIAQRGHDAEDALRSEVITVEEFLDFLEVGECKILKEKIQNTLDEIERSRRLIANDKSIMISRIVLEIYNYLISSVVERSKKEMSNSNVSEITFSNNNEYIKLHDNDNRAMQYLENVIKKRVICNSSVAMADENGNCVVTQLFRKYYHNPKLLPPRSLRRIFLNSLKNRDINNYAVDINDCSLSVADEEIKEWNNICISDDKTDGINKRILAKRRILIREITDYISGMTDSYAMEKFNELIF